MRKSTPVAFMDIDFSNDGKASPIVEVMLGPKNYSLPSGISVILETLGIGKVNITNSLASYR
jgi:hypothetical protein